MFSDNAMIGGNWRRVAMAAAVAVVTGASMGAVDAQEKNVERNVVVVKTDHAGHDMNGALREAAANAPVERHVAVDNTSGAPVAISDAQIKKVPGEVLAKAAGNAMVWKAKKGAKGEKSEPAEVDIEVEEVVVANGPEHGPAMKIKPFPPTDADGNARVLAITVTNVSGQVVSAYTFGNGNAEAENKVRFYFMQDLQPGETHTFVLPVAGPMLETPGFTLQVLGVKNADGSTWGEIGTHDKMVFVRRAPGRR